MLKICHYFITFLKTSFCFKCFLKYARNDLPKMYFEVILKGLNSFCIWSHVKQWPCTMLSIFTQWVNVILSIDLANGYACNFVHVVLLLFHWWNMFFQFNLIDFGANGDTFGWGTSLVLMLVAFVFFFDLYRLSITIMQVFKQ